MRTFLSEEKGQVLVRSIALDALHIARTLKFAATIGVRAQAMSPEELHRKGCALDRLLEQTESEMRELQVLLRQHSADIVARVERDLTAHVEKSVPVVRQHLRLFQAQHPRETGRAFGALLEDFFMEEIETVFRRWRVREDEEVQALLDFSRLALSTQANAILERLQQAAGMLFEIPIEPVIDCLSASGGKPSLLQGRTCFSFARFVLSGIASLSLAPDCLCEKCRSGFGRLLDMNAGRIRYDYLERLQSSMTQFEKNLSAAVTMVAESLRSALQNQTTEPTAVWTSWTLS